MSNNPASLCAPLTSPPCLQAGSRGVPAEERAGRPIHTLPVPHQSAQAVGPLCALVSGPAQGQRRGAWAGGGGDASHPEYPDGLDGPVISLE